MISISAQLEKKNTVPARKLARSQVTTLNSELLLITIGELFTQRNSLPLAEPELTSSATRFQPASLKSITLLCRASTAR